MIPKKIFFYWNSEKMSWMRYMTLFSFRKFNPDWEMTLFISNNNNVWDFSNKKQDYLQNLKNVNYFNKIEGLGVNVKKAEFPLEHRDALSKLNPIQESDVFRYFKLHDEGGFYSDMDILFLRPMDVLYNEISYQKADVVLYQDDIHIAIGFLGSSINNNHYKYLYENAFDEKKNDYQSHGVIYINQIYGSVATSPTIVKKIGEKYPNLVIHNLTKERFYQYDWRSIKKMFTSDLNITNFSKDAIGYHWYGGGELPQNFNAVLTEKNYQEHKITFCNLVKNIIYVK